jgi:hypothetical protein
MRAGHFGCHFGRAGTPASIGSGVRLERMQSDHRGVATVRKRFEAGTALVCVAVRFEPGEFQIETRFEQPVVLQPTPECSALYRSSEALFKCCEGSAMSGVFYATRSSRDTCGKAIFTKFDGACLPGDCGMGFALAAALACSRALGTELLVPEEEMHGWKEI